MNIARWDGANWKAMGSGLSGEVRSLISFNGHVIAGGDYAVGVRQWDGATWSKLGNDIWFGGVYSLAEFNNELIAAGDFELFLGDGTRAYGIARWDGNGWHSLNMGFDLVTIYALAIFDNKLIAAGDFYTAGGNTGNIAQWDGTTWAPLASGVDGTAYALMVSDNDLVVGGAFTTAGGQDSICIARWGPDGPLPSITQQPLSPAICDGGMFSLHVAASGNGLLSYQWQKAGVDLNDTSDRFGTQTDTLVFTDAHVSEAGFYDCVVKLNGCTQETSDWSHLSIYPTGSADGNADGLLDARDIQPFVSALVNFAPVSVTLCAYDLNADGIVNLDDLPPFVNRLLGS